MFTYILIAIIYILIGFILSIANELTYGKVWQVSQITLTLLWPYFIIKDLIRDFNKVD